ncbi:hypothetical protein ACQJBY_036090 [Aegilops geniculata]
MTAAGPLVRAHLAPPATPTLAHTNAVGCHTTSRSTLRYGGRPLPSVSAHAPPPRLDPPIVPPDPGSGRRAVLGSGRRAALGSGRRAAPATGSSLRQHTPPRPTSARH